MKPLVICDMRSKGGACVRLGETGRLFLFRDVLRNLCRRLDMVFSIGYQNAAADEAPLHRRLRTVGVPLGDNLTVE